MTIVCSCSMPIRRLWKDKCDKCGGAILSDTDCKCGQGKRFLFSDDCPHCREALFDPSCAFVCLASSPSRPELFVTRPFTTSGQDHLDDSS